MQSRVATKSTKKYSQLSDKQKAKVDYGSRSNYKQARATVAAKATPKKNTVILFNPRNLPSNHVAQ